tara:strand:+ start:96 stop:263 length:168 start_codon:yes stop_codon:yes gene_type:complete
MNQQRPWGIPVQLRLGYQLPLPETRIIPHQAEEKPPTVIPSAAFLLRIAVHFSLQ